MDYEDRDLDEWLRIQRQVDWAGARPDEPDHGPWCHRCDEFHCRTMLLSAEPVAGMDSDKRRMPHARDV